ncbi:MAG: dephospho-CoA kinase [Paludibacteraceae bacterium]
MIVGITGGIGCGKSVVSKIIGLMGYPVYDSDKNAKKIVDESDEIRAGLISRFGTEIYNGTKLNRKLLAEKIFSDNEARSFVNSLIHPAVLKDFIRWSELNLKKVDVVFIESAILFESGFNKYVDKILLVISTDKLRIERIRKRDNALISEIRKRIQSQIPQKELIKKSDFIIKNDEKRSLLQQIRLFLENIHSE